MVAWSHSPCDSCTGLRRKPRLEPQLFSGDGSQCTPENPCDIERTKAVAFDDNLIPNQWSVIEINLEELFEPGAPRQLGQMLVVGIQPNLAGMPLYFSNLYFYKRD